MLKQISQRIMILPPESVKSGLGKLSDLRLDIIRFRPRVRRILLVVGECSVIISYGGQFIRPFRFLLCQAFADFEFRSRATVSVSVTV